MKRKKQVSAAREGLLWLLCWAGLVSDGSSDDAPWLVLLSASPEKLLVAVCGG